MEQRALKRCSPVQHLISKEGHITTMNFKLRMAGKLASRARPLPYANRRAQSKAKMNARTSAGKEGVEDEAASRMPSASLPAEGGLDLSLPHTARGGSPSPGNRSSSTLSPWGRKKQAQREAADSSKYRELKVRLIAGAGPWGCSGAPSRRW